MKTYSLHKSNNSLGKNILRINYLIFALVSFKRSLPQKQNGSLINNLCKDNKISEGIQNKFLQSYSDLNKLTVCQPSGLMVSWYNGITV